MQQIDPITDSQAEEDLLRDILFRNPKQKTSIFSKISKFCRYTLWTIQLMVLIPFLFLFVILPFFF